MAVGLGWDGMGMFWLLGKVFVQTEGCARWGLMGPGGGETGCRGVASAPYAPPLSAPAPLPGQWSQEAGSC